MYIAAVEEVCMRLPPMEVKELRAESSSLVKKNCHPSNPTSHWRNKKQSRNSKETNP